MRQRFNTRWYYLAHMAPLFEPSQTTRVEIRRAVWLPVTRTGRMRLVRHYGSGPSTKQVSTLRSFQVVAGGPLSRQV